MKFGMVMQTGPLQWIDGKNLDFLKSKMAAAVILKITKNSDISAMD